MLYNLLYGFHTEWSWLNVFRYITLRSIGSAITAFLVVAFCGPAFIRWLRSRQIGQVVRDDGPETHWSKRGVPTMGGLFVLAGMGAAVLLWCDLRNGLVWLLLAISVFYAGIGAMDDWKKISKGNSRGISPREKLVLQIGGAAVAAFILLACLHYNGRLSLPFFKSIQPDLGWWYLPFAVLVIVGASNAVNLTDGLDGLAAGPILTTASTYLVFSYAAGNAVIASYLQIPYVEGVVQPGAENAHGHAQHGRVQDRVPVAAAGAVTPGSPPHDDEDAHKDAQRVGAQREGAQMPHAARGAGDRGRRGGRRGDGEHSEDLSVDGGEQ